jgi:hypothetical protein
MKLLQRWQYVLLITLGLFAAVSACRNNDEPAPVTSITAISSPSAPAGSSLTITGTNFSSTPASNSVTFGSTPATVVSATPTVLVVTVPSNAGSPITVVANGQTATFSGAFALGAKPVITLIGSISANTTWTKNNVYLIRGNVFVRSGSTLTIEPGTIIKGAPRDQDPENQGRGGTLIVLQGARIEARGTVEEPIVFTSSRPAGQRNYGDWGGIVIVGRAPHNREAARAIEGNVGVTMGAFNEPADNSGTLRYVRIEFPGIALTNAANSEINGLTLYGVGTGTTIEYVQVSYSGDDSFEWFGGTVNCRYLVALRGFDDDFDTDWGYVGKVQFGVSLRDPAIADQSGSNCFESDNFENPGEPATGPNTGLPLTQPVFANISGFAFTGAPSNASTAPTGGSGPYQSAMHLRRNTAISLYNSVFSGWPEGLRLEGTATGTLANVQAGRLDLQGITFANVGIPNSTTAIRGAGGITNAQAQDFFNTPAKRNVVVASSDIATLLFNAQNFNLTAPNFLAGAASPLLVAGNVATGGKLADSFFQPAPYRGAFGTTDWTRGWTNFNPQTTDYDK